MRGETPGGRVAWRAWGAWVLVALLVPLQVPARGEGGFADKVVLDTPAWVAYRIRAEAGADVTVEFELRVEDATDEMEHLAIHSFSSFNVSRSQDTVVGLVGSRLYGTGGYVEVTGVTEDTIRVEVPEKERAPHIRTRAAKLNILYYDLREGDWTFVIVGGAQSAGRVFMTTWVNGTGASLVGRTTGDEAFFMTVDQVSERGSAMFTTPERGQRLDVEGRLDWSAKRAAYYSYAPTKCVCKFQGPEFSDFERGWHSRTQPAIQIGGVPGERTFEFLVENGGGSNWLGTIGPQQASSNAAASLLAADVVVP